MCFSWFSSCSTSFFIDAFLEEFDVSKALKIRFTLLDFYFIDIHYGNTGCGVFKQRLQN